MIFQKCKSHYITSLFSLPTWSQIYNKSNPNGYKPLQIRPFLIFLTSYTTIVFFAHLTPAIGLFSLPWSQLWAYSHFWAFAPAAPCANNALPPGLSIVLDSAQMSIPKGGFSWLPILSYPVATLPLTHHSQHPILFLFIALNTTWHCTNIVYLFIVSPPPKCVNFMRWRTCALS